MRFVKLLYCALLGRLDIYAGADKCSDVNGTPNLD